MTEQTLVPAAQKVDELQRTPYLDAYLAAYREETGQEPVLTTQLTAEDDFGTQDIVYPLACLLYTSPSPRD